MIRRLFRRPEPNPRQRLLADARNAALIMRMVLVDARVLDAPDANDPATALSIWRAWIEKLQDWAEDQDQ